MAIINISYCKENPSSCNKFKRGAGDETRTRVLSLRRSAENRPNERGQLGFEPNTGWVALVMHYRYCGNHGASTETSGPVNLAHDLPTNNEHFWRRVGNNDESSRIEQVHEVPSHLW
jgi:hypothetical protein